MSAPLIVRSAERVGNVCRRETLSIVWSPVSTRGSKLFWRHSRARQRR